MSGAPELLEPRAVERPWGGYGLPEFGLAAPPGCRIGEWWVPSAGLPLLVKVIDARENLSVQLHPSDAAARELGLPSGKTEAWHVLAAEPGAHFFLGLAPGVEPLEFLAAAERGEDVSTHLRRLPARPGQTVFVPPGTVHAIGAGIVLVEAQQPADVTFRIYDWGRLPQRELHLREARVALAADPRAGEPPGADPRAFGAAKERVLVDCAYFRMSRLECAGSCEVDLQQPGGELWFSAGGRASVATAAGRAEVRRGSFCRLPGGAGAAAVDAIDGGAVLIRMHTT